MPERFYRASIVTIGDNLLAGLLDPRHIVPGTMRQRRARRKHAGMTRTGL